MSAIATPDINPQHRQVMLKALQKSSGRLTVGDAVALSGLGRDDAESTLRGLLSSHEGHLEVTDDGELLYLFDPKLAGRDDRPGWEKFKEKAWKGFKAGFKVWIMLMLVVYFVVYVTLAIAAFVAITANNNSNNSSSSRRSSGGFNPALLFYLFWTPGYDRRRSHYYGDTYQWSGQRKPKEQKVPFYLKVFAFVFGPDEPEENPVERDKRIAWWIRAKKGVVTTAELVEFTGLTYAEADSEMGRLLGAFDGEAHVTDEGEVVYSFEELMRSAQGPVDRKELPPAWHKLRTPRLLTGNKSRDNWIIGGFNGFNLSFALISPVIIFPILGIGGAAASVGLVVIPLIFSLLFFAVPAVRSGLVKRENAKRHGENVRRLSLRGVFEATREHRPLRIESVSSDVQRALSQVKTEGSPAAVQQGILATAIDMAGEPQGEGIYTFPTVASALSEGQRLRQGMRLDQQKLGGVVYGTGEDAAESGARELDDFDALLGGAPQFQPQAAQGLAAWEHEQEMQRFQGEVGETEAEKQTAEADAYHWSNKK